MDTQTQSATIPSTEREITYVPIGDSYTIGEGASLGEAWPALLAKELNGNGIRVKLAANPARTGWTTQQAIDNELPVFGKLKPDFSTLLIGVNDWVRGVDKGTFRQRLSALLDNMQEAMENKSRIIVVTIPDFSAAPNGKLYSGGRNISEGIEEFNDIIKNEAKARNLPVVDIFPASKEMENDRTLVAFDGLHPSAKEYAIWEKMIYPVAYSMLK